MGRPVKIFRVYYADSLGELDLPLATPPCPPVACACSTCFSLQPSLCSECVGRRVGRLGLGSRCQNAAWLPPGWGWAPVGSGSLWDGLCVHRVLCNVVCVRVGEGSAVRVIVSMLGDLLGWGVLARPGVRAPNQRTLSLCCLGVTRSIRAHTRPAGSRELGRPTAGMTAEGLSSNAPSTSFAHDSPSW